ncbi:MAG: hypothetical protein RSG77_05335 [Hafnia sp.]|uniref:hypothetical protein n=1 Tax=Hafnia sp. TaxID=1873498 RepID=UPI002FC99CAC
MKPLLLIVTETAPCGVWPEWHTVWCAPAGADITDSSASEVILMPAEKVPPLCQGLFAGACWSVDVPVALITDDQWLLPSPTSPTAQACLIEADHGMLFFPKHQQFVLSAQNAIRTHNPALGRVSLQEGFYQASILGLDSERAIPDEYT